MILSLAGCQWAASGQNATGARLYEQGQYSAALQRFQKVIVPKSVLLDLLLWSTVRNISPGISMVPNPPSLRVQTDASTTGWGCDF